MEPHQVSFQDGLRLHSEVDQGEIFKRREKKYIYGKNSDENVHHKPAWPVVASVQQKLRYDNRTGSPHARTPKRLPYLAICLDYAL